MERIGIIVEDNGGFSKVKLMRHSACGSCGACSMGDESKDVFLVARNQIGAKKGEFVEVGMPTAGILSAAFIMYMLPLAALFVGLGLGILLIESPNEEILSGGLGFLFMALTFMWIKKHEKNITKNDKYNAQILSIVQKNHEDLVKL